MRGADASGQNASAWTRGQEAGDETWKELKKHTPQFVRRNLSRAERAFIWKRPVGRPSPRHGRRRGVLGHLAWRLRFFGALAFLIRGLETLLSLCHSGGVAHHLRLGLHGSASRASAQHRGPIDPARSKELQ